MRFLWVLSLELGLGDRSGIRGSRSASAGLGVCIARPVKGICKRFGGGWLLAPGGSAGAGRLGGG